MKKVIRIGLFFLIIASMICSLIFSLVVIINLLKFKIINIIIFFTFLILLAILSFALLGKEIFLNDNSKIFDFLFHSCILLLILDFIYILISLTLNLSLSNFLSILLSIITLIDVTILTGNYLGGLRYDV